MYEFYKIHKILGIKMSENPAFLKEQIITYLGNKRSLLDLIESAIIDIKADLGVDKISFADVFSGSGVVSRLAKAHAKMIYANDLELYSRIINECYLSNFDENLWAKITEFHSHLNSLNSLKEGFITRLYAPSDDENIKENERVFFTRRNAMFIDTIRDEISRIPNEFQKFFIAPLLYEASVHNNTGGVFKGFYKGLDGVGKFGGEKENALSRIKGDISLPKPIFSNFCCDFKVSQKESLDFAKSTKMVDIAYLDPPYNQHPYSSNYFMLNLIASYKEPSQISKISGIPNDWNKSVYNQKAKAKDAFFTLLSTLKARYLLISFNNEGFIDKSEFSKFLSTLGKLEIIEQKYNTYRASRNLKERAAHTTEYLYILKKDKK